MYCLTDRSSPPRQPQAVPQLRSTANIRLFNAEMKQCEYNLDTWRQYRWAARRYMQYSAWVMLKGERGLGHMRGCALLGSAQWTVGALAWASAPHAQTRPHCSYRGPCNPWPPATEPCRATAAPTPSSPHHAPTRHACPLLPDSCLLHTTQGLALRLHPAGPQRKGGLGPGQQAAVPSRPVQPRAPVCGAGAHAPLLPARVLSSLLSWL